MTRRIFEGNCEPIRAVYASSVCENVSVVPAPASLDKMCCPDDMRRLCGGFARYYDHVLVDCPAGIGSGFACAIAGANRALVVCTPDMICARDAQIVGTLLENNNIPARLVINRLRPAAVMSGRMPDIDEIIDISGIQLIGVLPRMSRLPLQANGVLFPAPMPPCAFQYCVPISWKACTLARLDKIF